MVSLLIVRTVVRFAGKKEGKCAWRKDGVEWVLAEGSDGHNVVAGLGVEVTVLKAPWIG